MARFVAVTTVTMTAPMQNASGIPGFSISSVSEGRGSLRRSVSRSMPRRASIAIIAAVPTYCAKEMAPAEL